RGAHPAPNLRGLESRACRSRAGYGPRGRAEHDLRVGAHVYEEAHTAVERETGRDDAGHDVRADVGAERREEDRRRAWMDVDAELGGRRLRQAAGRDRERRHRQWLRVDPERELDHGYVSRHDDLVDGGRLDAALLADLVHQRRKGL